MAATELKRHTWALLVGLLAPTAFTKNMAEAPHIRVALVSSQATVAPGSESLLGIRFMPDEHWHVYWVNPGDTGMAPAVDWTLPAGAAVGQPQWGFPNRIPVNHLTNLGYEQDMLLPVTLSVGRDAADAITIEAEASWLVCKESCVPGKASLSTTLPVGDTPEEGPDATHFQQWRPRLPTPLALLGSEVRREQGMLKINLFAARPVFTRVDAVEVFVKNPDVVAYSPAKHLEWGQNWLRWRQALNDYFTTMPKTLELVIVVNHQQGYSVVIPTDN